MGLQKNELIAKLEVISALYRDTVAIQAKMDTFTPEDNYKREVSVPQFPGNYGSSEERNAWKNVIDHSDEDAIAIMDHAYARVFGPKEPPKPNIGPRPKSQSNRSSDVKQKQGCLLFIAGFVALCSLTSGGLFSDESLTVILNVLILAACGVAVFFFYVKYKTAKVADAKASKRALEDYEQKKQELEEQYAHDMKTYQDSLPAFEKSKTAFIDSYAVWREIYLSHLKEEEEIEEKLEADRVATVKKIYIEEYIPAKNNLDSNNDLVTEKYLPSLDVIIDLIKSSRADDLKEAINLLEDIRYRERQLAFEREKEEQRKYEEQQKREDEFLFREKQLAFEREKEEQRKYEEQQKREDEERRHREDIKFREQQERNRQQEEKERLAEQQRKQAKENLAKKEAESRATSRQCNACALASRCSIAFTRPNCASYRPR